MYIAYNMINAYYNHIYYICTHCILVSLSLLIRMRMCMRMRIVVHDGRSS